MERVLSQLHAKTSIHLPVILMVVDLSGVNQYLEARDLPLICSVPSPLFGCHG
jgi:hypothetical protein